MAHESSFERAKFLGAKLYIEEDEQGNLDVKAAGLGQNEVVKIKSHLKISIPNKNILESLKAKQFKAV